MAIVNRTTDSFYDQGATFAADAALARVRTVVAEGADMIDIGAIKAAPGEEIPVAEEIERTAGFVALVRAEFPDLVISVDTWRADVGRAAAEAGADVFNDAWGGWDPELAVVAAELDKGLVCTHAGGVAPRTRPHRVQYPDVVADVLTGLTGLADHAVGVGVDPSRIVIDPGHDFAKNTYHSLAVTRAVPELVATGWPVLMSLSNKDFVGETLDLPVDQRLTGTLAVTSLTSAWGARVFRAHNVRETRQTLDMVGVVLGHRPPLRAVRGLA
ncbi:dihydropteroate synthase [Jatrophihabitans sp. YIM 134969]